MRKIIFIGRSEAGKSCWGRRADHPFGIIDLFDTSRSEDAGGAAETDIRKIKICRRYVF